MTVQVTLPEDLVAQIDTVSADRSQLIERINDIVEELNREAADVLEYQTFS